ncbi:hypothetical protein B0H66DRAFT_530467 [Apodospora peruviana]|uniref:Uncharacterized protein n=1 Tax=Apodospora peruviana TaxID=516989 RepID=A0AAE0MBL7_9PEZI|nr:hypothetical protein B0H66DRAFT_530467 [Apodospora peruviana]
MPSSSPYVNRGETALRISTEQQLHHHQQRPEQDGMLRRASRGRNTLPPTRLATIRQTRITTIATKKQTTTIGITGPTPATETSSNIPNGIPHTTPMATTTTTTARTRMEDVDRETYIVATSNLNTIPAAIKFIISSNDSTNFRTRTRATSTTTHTVTTAGSIITTTTTILTTTNNTYWITVHHPTNHSEGTSYHQDSDLRDIFPNTPIAESSILSSATDRAAIPSWPLQGPPRQQREEDGLRRVA